MTSSARAAGPSALADTSVQNGGSVSVLPDEPCHSQRSDRGCVSTYCRRTSRDVQAGGGFGVLPGQDAKRLGMGPAAEDLDGSPDAKTVSFGLDGTTYENDVNDKNRAKLAQAIAPYIQAGRRITRSRSRTSPSWQNAERIDRAEVRA